jgi:hypothetical protein
MNPYFVEQHKENGMRVIGIYIATGQLRYSVLEGTKAAPVLVSKDRLLTPDPKNVPALMDWFDTQFTLILDQSTPNRIAYRLTLAPKKDQLVNSVFPLGILNLLVHRYALPITSYIAQNYVASRLGLAKGADIYAHCDSVLGSHPPYWDMNQKHSVLAAWFELP